MDLVFKCPHCEQELEVDAGGAGSTLQCPSCSNTITVPSQESGESTPAPAPPPPPPAEPKHFSVPVHEAATEALITKPNRPLEVVAKDGDKTMRIKTIKRSDCQEVGRDHFDERVSQFLEKVGQANIVSINIINYSALDMATLKEFQDYGVLVVYKG
jgi:DNA-directed RNA polymerase subunit RPC12/RpoP